MDIEPQTASSSSGLASSSPHHRRRYSGWIWLLIIAAACYGAYRYRKVALPPPQTATAAGGGRGGAGANVPVVAVKAVSGSVPVFLRGPGTVTPNYTVTIHPLVSGQIEAVHFQEGQFVQQGAPLLEIDPRPYEATLAQAQGQLAHDTALYNDDQLDYERYLSLYKQNIIPKQQVDSQQALVNEYKGAMATDEAAIKAAQLNITYSHITAPISGRIGLRLVDPGNVVQSGTQTSIAVITQVDPIAVLFNLPQEDLPQVYPRLRAGQHPEVAAYDSTNTKQLALGRLETIDDTIDPTTGTFRCKALFDNADNALFPNQFVNVRMQVGSDSGITVVPPPAIQRGPEGSYVFVVADNKVSVQPVTEKITEGNQVGLSSGLEAGQEVVIDGADRLQDGTTVRAQVQAMPAPLTAEAMGAAAPATAGARTTAPATATQDPAPSTAQPPAAGGRQHQRKPKSPNTGH